MQMGRKCSDLNHSMVTFLTVKLKVGIPALRISLYVLGHCEAAPERSVHSWFIDMIGF